jgi:hypothetical protein
MGTFNNILPKLIKKFPSLVRKETIEKLVLQDKNALSYEAASNCIGALDAFAREHEKDAVSTESESDQFKGDFDTKGEKDFTLEESTRLNFANVKFSALVDYAKEDDTFLYTEFVDVDAARNRVASEIVANYENDFNSFLVSLKTAEGVDKSVIDGFLQTKIHVGELN